MTDPGELRKVTMNFYARDIEYFEQVYGQGWSGEIREIVHNHVMLKTLYEEEDSIDA